MNSRDIQLLKKRNIHILLYTISTVALIIGTMCGISIFIVATISNNTIFMIYSALTVGGIILLFGGYIILQTKNGYGKDPIEPYRLYFKYDNISGFINVLQNYTNVFNIGENIYASKLVQGKNTYHILAYQLDTFISKMSDEVEKQTIHDCIDKGVFSTKITRYDLSNTVRINFIFLNDSSYSSYKLLYNSCQSLQVAEGIVNCYITSDGFMQLPALWGGYSLHSKKYNSALKLIKKL